eukprot:4886508-Prymnesium_polylepis.1
MRNAVRLTRNAVHARLSHTKSASRQRMEGRLAAANRGQCGGRSTCDATTRRLRTMWWGRRRRHSGRGRWPHTSRGLWVAMAKPHVAD